MSLMPYQPFFDFDRLWNSVKLPANNLPEGVMSPKVEIAKSDDTYQISAEFPGVDKEDIEITLENGILTLTAQNQSEQKKEEKGKVIYQERQFGQYSRSFNVGREIEQKDIKASFKDGVLNLKVPNKVPEEQKTQRIPIRS